MKIPKGYKSSPSVIDRRGEESPSEETVVLRRVFIASPKGLDKERKAFREVLREHFESDGIYDGLLFHPVGWEQTLGGRGRPQDLINRDLERCHYFILILHNRWGSATGSGAYSSGVEEEFSLALDCLKDEKQPMRQILVFFKAVNEDQMADPGEQLSKVLKFRQDLERSKEHLFETFDVTSNFERRLRRHLGYWAREQRDVLYLMATQLDTRTSLDESLARASGWISSMPELRRSIAELDGIRSKLQDLNKGSDVESDEAKSRSMAEEAAALAQEGRRAEAEVLFSKAVSNDKSAWAFSKFGAYLWSIGQFDRAEEMQRKSIQLATVKNDETGIATASVSLSNILATRGDLLRAKEMLFRSLEVFRESGDQKGMAIVYGNLATIYEECGSLLEAEDLQLKSLQISEASGHLQFAANAHSNLGLIYQARGDLDSALESHQESLRINESIGGAQGIANSYSNIGRVHHERRDLDKALEMQQESLRINDSIGSLQGLAHSHLELGDLHITRGDLRDAAGHLEEALKLSRQLRAQRVLGEGLRGLGRLSLEREDLASAEHLLHQALETFEGACNFIERPRTYDLLAELYEAKSDPTQAQEYRAKAEKIRSGWMKTDPEN